MQQKPGDFSMEEAIRFAQSPKGQQLLSLLKRSSDPDLQKAMSLAAKGDLQQAQEVLKGIQLDPQIRQFLQNREEHK